MLPLFVFSLFVSLWMRGLCQNDTAVYIVTLKQAPAVHQNGFVKGFASSEINNGASGATNTLNKPNRYLIYFLIKLLAFMPSCLFCY